mmetsp:Transcript_57446/g.136768  ORF Transcript_57446/g.136768 Transcript_57446/m.136768 type:complete len:436 (-) Transcript_57446:19-1326(-)
MCLCIRKRLGVIQGGHSRQHLALKQLQGGTTASAAVGHLVLRAVLLAGRRGVPAADDGDHSLASGLHHGVHQLLGAALKLRHLEDAHGAVPNDGLGLSHRLGVALNGGGAAVQAHEALGDSGRQRGRLDLSVLAELGGANKVRGQHDLHALGLRLLHDLRHDLRALLVEEGVADAHAVQDLDEGEGHAAADDHGIHLVKHVLDELNLVTHLGASQDGADWVHRAVQHLRKGLQLLGYQEAGALHGVALAHHGAVPAVRRAEGVAAVNIRQLRQRGTELLGLLLVGLDLVSVLVHTLALFLYVVAAVLQQDHRARRRARALLLHLRADAVLQEGHRLRQLLLQALGHRLQGVLGHGAAIRASQVGTEHHRAAALIQAVLDGRQRRVNPLGVGDHAGVLLILRNIEVYSDEHALAGDVHGIDPKFVECHVRVRVQRA